MAIILLKVRRRGIVQAGQLAVLPYRETSSWPHRISSRCLRRPILLPTEHPSAVSLTRFPFQDKVDGRGRKRTPTSTGEINEGKFSLKGGQRERQDKQRVQERD